MNRMKKTALNCVSLIALATAFHATPAVAQTVNDKAVEVRIKAQPMELALNSLAQQLGKQIVISTKDAQNLKAVSIQGIYSDQQALDILLRDTGLNYKYINAHTIAVFAKGSGNGSEFQKISYENGEDYEANLAGYDADDENSDADTVSFDEIIVTASRREQALQDVPASITTVNPIEFTHSGLTSIGDIIEYTPGFNINRGNGQRGRGSITARGVGQQGATAVVAVYVDDIPMTSNSGFANGGALFFDGLLGDVERVELIKGPQGTLFGATAIGGAIRYITKKPALSEMRGGGSVNLSNTKDGGFNQIYSGFLSMPVIEDKLGVTVSGFYEDDGGLVDRIDPATGNVSVKNADTSESFGFSGDILFQASEEFEIRLKALHQKVKFSGTSAVELADLNKTPTYGKLSGVDQFSLQDTKQTYVSATLNYDFDWATLTATGSYVKYDIGAILDYTAIFSGLADILQGNPPGTTTDAPFSSPISSEKYAQEVRLTSQNSDEFEWIVGLYYAEESTTQDQLLITQPGDFLMALASFPSEYKEYAAFANLTYYVTPDFDLTAGMRYADTTMDLKFITDGPLVGGPSDPATESLPTAKANIQTYLLTARYRPNENMSLYARIASGYRPASANLIVVNPLTGIPASDPIVEQDNLWSYEIGAKGSLAEGMFSYDMSLWYLDWSNFQAAVSLFGTSALGNAKDGITAKGFEGAFTLKPADGFTVTSTVAYTHSTLNEDEEKLNGLKGQFMPTVPKWTASTRANYDYDISSDVTGSFGAGFRYVQGSPSALDDGDIGDSAVSIMSDSYFLVDVNAGVQMGDVALNFYVTNLFNQSAFANITALLIPGATEVAGQPIPLSATGTPIRPRTMGVVLSFDF